jgi:GNAT superfamily N-acetyltransferase
VTVTRSVKTLVTFLEMQSDPRHHVPPPANLKLFLMRAESPPVHFYRYLYGVVGGGYMWIDRKRMGDEELAAVISGPDVEIFVLYVAGSPAGYYEVDSSRKPAEVELRYFGIVPEFQGRGLGRFLLAEAIKTCWAHAPGRVVVNTCTLDSPRALPLYQRMGFEPYDRQTRMLTLSDG